MLTEAIINLIETYTGGCDELIQGAVMIQVTEATIVTSLSYDVGASAEQLSEQWLRRYAVELGFDVIRQVDSGRGLISSAKLRSLLKSMLQRRSPGYAIDVGNT